MFQEMCCAIISLVLIATAGVYPKTHLKEINYQYSYIITINWLLLLYDSFRLIPEVKLPSV